MKMLGIFGLVFSLLIILPIFHQAYSSGNNTAFIAQQKNITETQPFSDSSSTIQSVNYLQKISDSLDAMAKKNDSAQWAGAAVALLLGLAGIFQIQDWVKRRLVKPVMKVKIRMEPPDSHKIAMRNTVTGQILFDVYYFRFRVINDGNYYMEEVEVMAEELYRKGVNGRYSKVYNFLPLNLVWAHNHEVTMPKIQPKLFKHCDFGHVQQTTNTNLAQFGLPSTSNVVFILDSIVTPNTGSNILLPGEYKIKMIFAANNVSPKVIWYKLRIDDAWNNNEQYMLQNNISIAEIRR